MPASPHSRRWPLPDVGRTSGCSGIRRSPNSGFDTIEAPPTCCVCRSTSIRREPWGTPRRSGACRQAISFPNLARLRVAWPTPSSSSRPSHLSRSYATAAAAVRETDQVLDAVQSPVEVARSGPSQPGTALTNHLTAGLRRITETASFTPAAPDPPGDLCVALHHAEILIMANRSAEDVEQAARPGLEGAEGLGD